MVCSSGPRFQFWDKYVSIPHAPKILLSRVFVVLVLSPLSDLRSAFPTANETDDRPYQPQRKVSLGAATPNIVVFAYNDSRLIVGFAEGSIMVYATEHLFSPGDGTINSIYSLPAVPSAFVVSISPNTGDLPELVAILRDSQGGSNGLAVELLDVQKLSSVGGWVAGSLPNTIPASSMCLLSMSC
jgi:nucleoporin NUP159